ncbi:hypothetical protein SPWS13_1557 [Shewanella putrefaciens]|nr:hypothetical protein SPWS13_1557 [Shewanella putrefaciens]
MCFEPLRTDKRVFHKGSFYCYPSLPPVSHQMPQSPNIGLKIETLDISINDMNSVLWH